MHLLLLTQTPKTNLTKNIIAIAKHSEWELTLLTFEDYLSNSKELPEIRQIIIDANNEELFRRFHHIYVKRQLSINIAVRFYLFVNKYNHHQASLFSTVSDVSYLVTPESQKELKAYFHYEENIEPTINYKNIEKLLFEVVDYSAIISAADSSGKIIYTNENFCQISGYTKAELSGKNHSILNSDYHDANFFKKMWKTLYALKPWRGYIRNKTKKGNFYWVDSTIYPISHDGKNPELFISVRYNVTDEILVKQKLIESEERFRISHNYAAVGVWDWDITTNILVWTEEIHKLFGYQSPILETTYENFLAAIHPKDRDLVTARVDDAINNNKEYNVEHRVVWPDGTVRWVLERGHVQRDAKGQATRMLGVVVDISDQKHAQVMAYEAEQLKSLFISTLSHEVRNPLNAMLGYSQRIKDLSIDGDVEAYADKIINLVTHTTEILDEVNFNSKLETGQITHNIESIDIEEAINESIDIFSSIDNDITISIEKIHGTVEADKQHLRQVITNLISNAIKYNKKGGSVYIKSKQINDDYIRIEVEDTGQGISESKVKQIFKPFERLEWRNSEIDGLGIGLSISQLLIEGMSGAIGVNSKWGKGSTFWIDLPKSKQVVISEEKSKFIENAISQENKKVLILEDNAFNQELIELQLNDLGHQTWTASNGLEGLLLVEKHQFDIIITDLNMPKMDGLSFIKNIRNHYSSAIRDTPIIIATADNSGKERYRHAGATGFLIKPFSSDSLSQLINEKIHENNAYKRFTENSDEIINIILLNQYLGSNTEKKNRLIKVFIKSINEQIPQLEKANANNDVNSVYSITHRLSSSSLSVGAEKFAQLLRLIEYSAKDKELTPVQDLITEVINLSPTITSRLEKVIDDSSNINPLPIAPSSAINKETSILILDDDEFSLSQIAENFANLKFRRIQLEKSPEKALQRLRKEHFQIIIFDINMPDIDGIQFIRMFSKIYNNQSVIIYSGEKSLVNPVMDLINKYEMHCLGVLEKPSTLKNMNELLNIYNNKTDHPQPRTDTIISDTEIIRCLEEDSIQVLYQPQVNLKNEKIVSIEALSRLIDLNGNIIPPVHFLDRLLDLDLEDTFSLKVSEIAIKELANLKNKGFDLNMAINFSMYALENLHLPDQLLEICKKNKIDTSQIIVEVTESALSAHPKQTLEVIVRLRLMGFILSIDDFGTGYASMDKLKTLPFTEMKLDRSYVATAKDNSVSMALLTSSLGLAKQLNMLTVAEGIECREDLAVIIKAGADIAQGYYFSKPISTHQLIELIKVKNHDESSQTTSDTCH